jgi:ABC-type tungstate transport system permease subunit
MCLQTKDLKVFKTPSTKTKVGYKVFAICEEQDKGANYKLRSLYRSSQQEPFQLATWYTDTNDAMLESVGMSEEDSSTVLVCLDYDSYPAGFHIYTNKKDAKRLLSQEFHSPILTEYKVFKVIYEQVVAKGKDSIWLHRWIGFRYSPTIVVAKRMCIMP